MLVMIRVGETLDERENRFPTGDTRLTAQGYESAVDARDSLQGYRWDAVYCGPSQAAICTARCVRDPVIIRDALADRSGGVLEGVGWEEIREMLPPKRYKLWERDYFRSPSGGESYKDIEDRLQVWCNRTLWPRLERNHHILVVRSETPLRVLLGLLKRMEPDEIFDTKFEPGIPYFWHGKRPDPKG